MGKPTEATIMATTVSYKRINSSSNWTSLSEATNEVTIDLQSVCTNTELAILNDWYMMGLLSTNITLANTTCIDVSQTVEDSVSSNTYFYLIDRDDSNNLQSKLATAGYSFIYE